MATRWARVVRGFVAAVVSTFVAATCHVSAGGNIPVPFALVACLVVSTFLCVAFSGKRLSLAKLGTAVSLSQLLFHGVFSMWMPQAQAMTMTGHMHEHFFLLVPPHTPGLPADSGMWLAHGLAAAVTTVALRHGEKAFWNLFTIARLWVRRSFVLSILARPIETAHPARPLQRLVPLRELVLKFARLHHRGPPLPGATGLALG